MEGQIKCFSEKVKFKEFIITKTLLYEMLKVPGRGHATGNHTLMFLSFTFSLPSPLKIYKQNLKKHYNEILLHIY